MPQPKSPTTEPPAAKRAWRIPFFGLRELRAVWSRARREHSSPREVGWSVAIGVFCGSTPLWGLHMWMALGLATAFKLNRLWAFLGSRVSTAPIFVWIAFAEIEVSHRLRTGTWSALSPRDALDHGRALLLDWTLGTMAVAPALATTVGLLAYAGARRWPVKPRTPDALLPPSSGSPPSGPPAPFR